ncbi:SpoIIE family protein phosphatase [candidate division KSB1 bacterium]|nr:SpoIIE family protein phosphatase [candidate division KSB1 bacterium]
MALPDRTGSRAEPRSTSESVKFNSGDIFVFYTDGLVEAQNQRGQTFDEKRLAVYVRNHLDQTADDLLNGIFETAKDLAGKFHDDVT